MEKIDFVNNTTPALNMTNLNKLQDNVEEAIENVTLGGDTLPLYAMVDYDGDTVPEGYEQIIDSGSNENGNWVKYDNGTLIQYGIVEQANANTANSNISAGGYRSSGYDFNFPIEFSEKPKTIVVTPMGDLTVSGVFPDLDSNLTKKRFQLIWWSVVSNATIRTLKASYIAIGRWK